MRTSRGVSFLLVSLCSFIWLSGDVNGAEEVPEQREGDPPRIKARDLYEYRHMQLFNPDYLKWIGENIHGIDFVRKPDAMSLKWDTLIDVDLQESPVVVMVTQTTVSRLEALRRVMKEWNGPVTVAVYIEYQSGSNMAASCEGNVTQYMKEAVAELWTNADSAPPISVSFLYTAYDIPGANCTVKLSGSDHGAATRRGQKDYGSPRIPSRLRNRFDRFKRNLLIAQGQEDPLRRPSRGIPQRESTRSDPSPVKDLWHFRAKRRSRLKVSSRPWKQVYDEFYPVNALRNLAWQQVPSGVFVFLNDVDFVPTPTLHMELTEGKWKPEMKRMRSAYYTSKTREALVLPAFERLGAPGGGLATPWNDACEESAGCSLIQGMAIPRTFDMLRKMLQQENVVDVFDRSKFVIGHGCYSWLSWLQDKNPKDMIHMDYAHPCEPYVIALSDALPRYDERFRGRGQNKIEQLTHMAMWGFNWRLLPGHFILHVPHPSTTKPDEGWDIETTPLALLKRKIAEVEKEPQFRRSVVMHLPQPVKND